MDIPTLAGSESVPDAEGAIDMRHNTLSQTLLWVHHYKSSNFVAKDIIDFNTIAAREESDVSG